jgi:signal transduction histidine kinase
MADARTRSRSEPPPHLPDGFEAGPRAICTVQARDEQIAAARHAVLDYLEPLEPARAGDIALAVSEVVTNSVRHAEATTIEIAAEALVPDTLRITVTDDGEGMHPDPLAKSGPGIGLAVVARLGISVQIEPNEPRGTRVVLTVPMAEADRAS